MAPALQAPEPKISFSDEEIRTRNPDSILPAKLCKRKGIGIMDNFKALQKELQETMGRQQNIVKNARFSKSRIDECIQFIKSINGALDDITKPIPKTDYKGIRIRKADEAWLYLLNDGRFFEITLNIDNTVNYDIRDNEYIAINYGAYDPIKMIHEAVKALNQRREEIIKSNATLFDGREPPLSS
jgi:hypothetical protein